jgi:hydroxyacylglutathione hydrolase
MEIKQFEDKNLAHFSYAILSNGEIALVDPARDPRPYYEYAAKHNAKISAIIETHPHADFVSSHLEISKHTGANIYVSKLVAAEYDHVSFDEGDALIIGSISLKALNTPGHSPDSISVLLLDDKGNEIAVFSGDTLFIGDCGRPDLREQAGAITAGRAELAKLMYHSLRNKYLQLADSVIVYPAHGAGSLCGKGLSEASSSTMGAEKLTNWSLQNLSETEFVNSLLKDQPYVPKYFPHDVSINKKGAANFAESLKAIEIREAITCEGCAATLNPHYLIIDTRPETLFKASHLKNAINLMNDTKFETWLGSIIDPNEKFYLQAQNETELNELLKRIAKIGYESQVELAFISEYGIETSPIFHQEEFESSSENYTIVDIRTASERAAKKIFTRSYHIPLAELRERYPEIPTEKPIVVHCAGGYRSAAGASILTSKIKGKVPVYDFSERIKQFAL